MTTVYSGWSDTWKPSGSSVYKKYRARLDYTTSYTETTFTCKATTYVNINSPVDASYSGKEWATNGTTYTGSASTVFSSGNTTVTIISQKTYTWARGTTAQTKYVYGSVMSNKKDWDGIWTTATASFTVPALASYTVTYDGNLPAGETGTIGNLSDNQIKYHDIDLTLSENTPTLENWVFQGWNTAADGSGTSYTKGDTYATNADVTLYAQWDKLYIAPFISGIIITRVETSSSTTPYDEGDYLCVTLENYNSGDVPADGGSRYKQTTMTLVITENGNDHTLTPIDSNSFTGTGAEKNIHYFIPTVGYLPSYPTSESYPVELTFTTTGHGSVTSSLILSSSVYPIDVASDASLMTFGVPVKIKQDLYMELDENDGGTDQALYDAILALGWDSDVIIQ